MANKNYPVRPDSSLKAAPVRKKDVTEALLEVNELAEKLLEQMKADQSAELPLGVGGVKVPDDLEFTALEGCLTFTDSTPSKDGKDMKYTGEYRLKNLPDEEYGSIDIVGKFNLILQ